MKALITEQDLLDLRIDPNKPIEIYRIAKRLKYGYKIDAVPGWCQRVMVNSKHLSRAKNLEILRELDRYRNPHIKTRIVGE